MYNGFLLNSYFRAISVLNFFYSKSGNKKKTEHCLLPVESVVTAEIALTVVIGVTEVIGLTFRMSGVGGNVAAETVPVLGAVMQAPE